MGTEYTYTQGRRGQIFQNLNAGYFFNKYNAKALFLETSAGYRYTLGFGLFGDVALGLGYLHSFHPVEVYTLNSQGEYEKAKDKGKSSAIIPGILGLGYDFSRKLGWPLSLFLRYQDGFLENLSDIIYERQANLACGASGIIASMADHARFLEALFTGQLVSPVFLEEIKTGAPVPACNWRGIGIGIIPWMDNQGNEIITLGGEGSGIPGMTKAYYIPDFGITFCFSTNIGSKNDTHADVFHALYSQVMDAVFNGRAQTMPDFRKKPLQLPDTKKARIKK